MCGIYVLPNIQTLWEFIQYVGTLFLSNIDHGAERKKYCQSRVSSPLTEEKQISTNRPDELVLTAAN